ncbi:condensation domain-containing protein [Catellatospora methionotrophica]|uniref:condensation domain-containing protein n=1 Tax=Catellatospora methionotrophica TaxID=121620 RepID=UPI0033EFC195
MRLLPLSALQQRFWHLCTAYPGDASPILFLTWRIRGPLDLDRWQTAVSAVVDRHESLRTGFALRDGEPVQVVGPPTGITTELIDLSGQRDPDEQAQRVVSGRTHRLLDLITGPLVESCLVRLAADHHVWCFTMHHLLADGASLRIVGHEVRDCYAAPSGTALPPLQTQYGDFARWQREQEESDASQLAYWREQLIGVPPLDLPTDRPRPPHKGTASSELIHRMDGELATAVIGLSRAARCTPFMVLLAALQVLLREHSGQDDFAIGSPAGGRVRAEFEPVVGLFANTLALRTDLTGDPTLRELLARTRKTVIGALQRQTFPFGRIVAALGPPRDPSRTQVFQVIFSMRNDNEAKQPQLGPLLINDFPHGHPKVLHDLVFDIWRLDSHGLRAGIRYDTALFAHDTILALARRYEQILSAAVTDPDARLSALAPPRG